MTAMLVEEELVASTSDPDEPNIEHLFCECSPNVALCGEDFTNATDHTGMDTPIEDDCVVCVDLGDLPCSRCGKLNQ